MDDADRKPRSDKFQKDDRVFAKLRFCPPWPAQVHGRSEGKEEKYLLIFYGTHDLAHVKPQMMYPYTPETSLKFGTPSKPSLAFKIAMKEIDDNVQLYLPIEEPQKLEKQVVCEASEEGEVQIDEPPPVLKREGKLTTLKPKISSNEPVVKKSFVKPPLLKPAEVKQQPPAKSSLGKQSLVKSRVVKQPAVEQNSKRLNKSTKKVLVSSTSVAKSDPVTETPAQIVPQSEVVSRSGRKIKPNKRFASDEIDSPAPVLVKAVSQSSIDQLKVETPVAVKRSQRRQKLEIVSSTSPTSVTPDSTPIVMEVPVTSKAAKAPTLPKIEVKTTKPTIKQTITEPLPTLPTPTVSNVSSSRKIDADAGKPVPVSNSSLLPIPSEIYVPSTIDTLVSSNKILAPSIPDDGEHKKELSKEDSHETTDDKENFTGNSANITRAEVSSSEDSLASSAESKQMDKILASSHPSNKIECIKMSLAMVKDTDVEITYNHDKPLRFMTQQAQVKWNFATAKNIIKVKQILQSFEPQVIEVFDSLVTTVKKKYDENIDMNNMKENEAREKRSEKIRMLRTEGEAIEIIADVIHALNSKRVDCDIALELLNRLKNLNLNALMLKKNSEIVEIIRKLRHYEGNADVLDFTPEEAEQFDEKTLFIREIAHEIYEDFKEIFDVDPNETFQQVYEDELAEFTKCCSLMLPKDILNLTDDPSNVEDAAISKCTQCTDCSKLEGNSDEDLDEVSNDSDDDESMNSMDEAHSREKSDFLVAGVGNQIFDDQDVMEEDEEEECKNPAESDSDSDDLGGAHSTVDIDIGGTGDAIL